MHVHMQLKAQGIYIFSVYQDVCNYKSTGEDLTLSVTLQCV